MKNANLKIKSRTEKLSVVRDFILDAALKFGFDEDTSGQIALAVDEACTNIIKYSYLFAEDRDIDIAVRANNGAFEVVITDRGRAFNPDDVKAPDMKEYLQHYRRGGLGMYLMRSLMDKVEYKISDGKNEVFLVKYFPVRVGR